MAALVLFGSVSLGRLGLSYMPDVDFPVLSVRLSWPGAAPEVMEAEVVDRIERALLSVEGLREVTSNVRQGAAEINLEFNLERNVEAALQEVQTALASQRLPPDLDPPVIRKQNPEEDPIIWLGLSGTSPERDLFVIADQTLVHRLQLLPGVGEVFLGGASDRNLRVWVNVEKLRAFQLTMLDIRDALRLEHSEAPGGYLDDGRTERNLRTLGEAPTAREMEQIRITRRGGRPIYFSTIRLGDVARVEDGLSDRRRITHVSGKPGLSIGIRKQKGSNAVAVGAAVRSEVVRLAKDLPQGHTLRVVFDSTVFVREAVEETEFTLLLSALLTGLVCLIFLGNWGSTANVLLSIPTSILGTLVFLYFSGFTLNLFTLLALSLAVGIVVDDAIMVLENIVRHGEMGKSPTQAAIDGASQIMFAALAATLAVIAVFLPVAFMEGVIGKFFFQFGLTISVAVALSLVEAITLTPMRAAQLRLSADRSLRIFSAGDTGVRRLAGLYRAALAQVTRRPGVGLGVSLVLFGLSLLPLLVLRREFVPPQDQSQFGVAFRTAVGSSLEATEATVTQFERFLMGRKEVEGWVAIMGGFRGGESNRGMLFLAMKPRKERAISQQGLMALSRSQVRKIDGLEGVVIDFSNRGLAPRRTFPLEFSIRGAEWSVLKVSADRIRAALTATGLVTDVDIDYHEGMPEVRVVPDRRSAAAHGVSMEELVGTVGAAMGGLRQGSFTNEGRRYDVRLRLQAGQWADARSLRRLQLRNSFGELVDLPSIARVEMVKTVQTLTRVDRQRSINFTANTKAGSSQAEALSAAKRLAEVELPAGYVFRVGGSSRGFGEAFGSLLFALWLGILVAYMVLGAQFNSFVHPIAVLLALPFSVSGCALALLVTNQSVNLYSMIGIILLMGIAKKNSILLVEFANECRNQGASVRDAVLEAARVRLRPILMTTASTIAAALPPALALGPGAESRIPMAVSVIGGMLVSTCFTLFVVPCAYLLLSRFERSAPRGGLS